MKKLICVMITLVLLLAAVCAASAETIQAKPVTIDINRLEGRMVKTDIDYKEGDIMTLTLYESERFDAEAIRAVKVGDVITEHNLVSLKQTGAAKMREDIERRVTGNLVSMLTIRRGGKEVIVKLRKAD